MAEDRRLLVLVHDIDAALAADEPYSHECAERAGHVFIGPLDEAGVIVRTEALEAVAPRRRAALSPLAAIDLRHRRSRAGRNVAHPSTDSQCQGRGEARRTSGRPSRSDTTSQRLPTL